MQNAHPPLFLASKSPRRQELLRQAGVVYKIIDVEVEEDYPLEMIVEDIPEYLACKKAEAAMPLLGKEDLVLTADSIVILDNTVFGKPADVEEATKMLTLLAGRHHLVITGVFIGNKQKAISFSEFTSVWLEKMSPEEIRYYIESSPPMDKAGAYGIQDWIGWSKVSRIEGSYANVMGLPVQKVYEVLRKW
jgi:septum formation protein